MVYLDGLVRWWLVGRRPRLARLLLGLFEDALALFRLPGGAGSAAGLHRDPEAIPQVQQPVHRDTSEHAASASTCVTATVADSIASPVASRFALATSTSCQPTIALRVASEHGASFWQVVGSFLHFVAAFVCSAASFLCSRSGCAQAAMNRIARTNNLIHEGIALSEQIGDDDRMRFDRDKARRERLESKGWKVGTPNQLLQPEGWAFATPDDCYDFHLCVEGTVARDHGWHLFGALSAVASIHGRSDVQVAPISGEVRGDRLDARSLTVRGPLAMARSLLALTGRELAVGPDPLRVRSAEMRALAPSPDLASRLVLFHEALDPASFWRVLEEQILRDDLGRFNCEVTKRRLVRIKGHTLFGWGVRLSGLSPAASLRVQARGLGAGRRFGCGVFSSTSRR